jgi:DNA-binding transcriptional LysR family regulator
VRVNSLKRARGQFGDPLVVRQGTGFALTPKAEALAPRLRKVLAEMQSLLVADDQQIDPHWVTIACLDAISMTLVPTLLPLMHKRLPDTRLRTLTPDHVRFVGLERAEVDLAVGALPNGHSGCEVEDLFEDPLVVIAAANHPRIGSRLSVETYASLPHAELGLFGEPEDRVDRALAPHGLTRRTEVVVPHLAALPFLVSNSERVATVTRTIARQFARPLGLRMYRPPVSLSPLVIRMVWHHRRSSDRTHLALRDLIRVAVRRMTVRRDP